MVRDYGGTGTAVIRQDMTGMMDVRCFVVYFPAPHPQPGPVRPKICANAMFDVSFLWHSFTYLHAPFISYSFPTYPSAVSVILSPPPPVARTNELQFFKNNPFLMHPASCDKTWKTTQKKTAITLVLFLAALCFRRRWERKQHGVFFSFFLFFSSIPLLVVSPTSRPRPPPHLYWPVPFCFRRSRTFCFGRGSEHTDTNDVKQSMIGQGCGMVQQ